MEITKITQLPSLGEIENCQKLQIRSVREDGMGYLHIVTREWFRENRPKVGGFIEFRDPDYQRYYDQAAVQASVAAQSAPSLLEEASIAQLFGFGDKLPQKITPEFLYSQIKFKKFEVRSDGRTTICEVTLANGATYRGESTCAVKEEFVAKDGEFYAEKDAINKVWAFYGVLLRELRFRAGLFGWMQWC